MIGQILLLLSAGILGIFVGSQITEAVLFVPYWKKLSPEDFFDLHRTYGMKIHRFYAPLTILATLVPLATVLYHLVIQEENQILFVLLGVCTALFFSTYFLFFKKANKSFADRSIHDDALPGQLDKWGKWHWCRIVFECIALGISLVLLY